MDFAAARHLVSRTSFGGTPAGISRLQRRGLEGGVQELLEGMRDAPVTPPPPWAEESVSLKGRRRSDDERIEAMAAWWCAEIHQSDSPLTERMVLFWSRFAGVGRDAVGSGPLLARHHALLRKHAGGSFKALLLGLTADPATLLAFGPEAVRGDGPGPGFARKLLEDWTLGPGVATEQDIAQVTRAFTGWGVDEATGSYRYRDKRHDGGEKTVLGQVGLFNGTDIVNLLLDDPRTSEHVVRQLWMELAGVRPDLSLVTDLAAQWRAEGLEIKALLDAVLRAPAFLAEGLHGQRVKPPAELLLGTIQSLYLPWPDAAGLARTCARLGQDLMAPETWTDGAGWLTVERLEMRRRWLRLVVRESGAGTPAPLQDDTALRTWLGKPRIDAERARSEATRALLPLAPVLTPHPQAGAGELLLGLLLDPIYQLS